MPFPFAEPVWLMIGILSILALAAFFLSTERRAWKRLRRFAAPGLLDRLTDSHSRKRLWIKNAFLVLAVLLLCLSLARPQWGANWEKAETKGIDIMIALDTSRSMLAEDISPNRLERSKLAILDLLEAVRGDRVGLIAFAGNAFLQCPLTLDYQAFRQTLQAVDTESIPTGGTDIASAIDEADAYFEESGNDRLLILITDGEDLEASGVARAREAVRDGMRILTVGVGSTSGELIPVRGPDGQVDFLRDASGNPVSTALDESTLRRIAEASNGLYAPLGPTGAGLLRVYEFSLSSSEQAERQEMLQRIPIERYQWPLLAAIVLLILEAILTTRRKQPLQGGSGALGLLLATGLLLVAPPEAGAGPAREAAKAYQEGRYEESVTLYREAVETDPDNPKLHYNLGVSAYRAGNYEDAIAQFILSLKDASASLQAKAFHNAGNSRVARGFESLDEQPELARDQWQAAISDYDNALALDPDLAKAQANREAILATIEAHTYQLTTVADPEEAGSVSPGMAAFHKIPVEISAKAADGWLFTAWSGDGIEDPEKAKTSVRLEEDTTVTANFVKTWNLEVISEDPEAGSAGKSGTYREDEPVPIKAEAEDYYAFSKWIPEGGTVADPAQAETTVTLTGDARVTATFVPAFKLSAIPEPEIGGKVGPEGFFEEYSVVPIQAEPRPGFEWRGWIGDGIKDPSARQTTISLTADRIAIARMERIWNLVIIPTPEEGGTVEGAGNHPVGSTVDIAATPAEGFTFEGWEGPGVADPAAPNTRVTVQSTEHTLFARFKKADDQQDDQDQDQQEQEDQEQQDQDQNQDQQDQQDQQEQEQQDQDRQDQDSEQQDQQESGEDQQQQEPQDPQQQEEQDQEEQGEQPEDPRQDAGPEEQMQVAPGEMTREEARQLLNALDENDRFLPASERSRDRENADGREGRNW